MLKREEKEKDVSCFVDLESFNQEYLKELAHLAGSMNELSQLLVVVQKPVGKVLLKYLNDSTAVGLHQILSEKDIVSYTI